jgi:hypothetical protein
MVMYGSFVPHFRKATFCDVSSCMFEELGCAAGEKRLWNAGLREMQNCVQQ